jgi:hypothetical protein
MIESGYESDAIARSHLIWLREASTAISHKQRAETLDVEYVSTFRWRSGSCEL